MLMHDTDINRSRPEPEHHHHSFFPRPGTRVCLTADLDGLHLRLLDLGLGHGDREHAVLQPGLHLVRLGVLRQAEPAEELAAAALDAVPLVVLVLLLLTALAADDQDVAVLHLDLDLLLLDTGEVGLEDVRLGGLLPVDARVGEGGGVAARL